MQVKHSASEKVILQEIVVYLCIFITSTLIMQNISEKYK